MLVKTSQCDVLIIGAGPAGMMMALWMARMGVNVRIVDKRTDKIFSGQADGFQARTLEILDSFGIGERVWKEGNRIYGEFVRCETSGICEQLLTFIGVSWI